MTGKLVNMEEMKAARKEVMNQLNINENILSNAVLE
jgi:hypothetical protein